MTNIYFAYSSDNGFQLFSSASDAETFAGELLRQYRDDSYDSGWDEGVSTVCWGRLNQNAYGYDLPNVPGEMRGYDYFLADV